MRTGPSLAALVLALVPALSADVASSKGWLGPWVDPGVDLGEGVQSARVLLADQALLSGPWSSAPRRGSAARDVHLPIFAARYGPGCKEAWLAVGPSAWVCSDAV